MLPESHWDHKDLLFFAPLEDSRLVLAASGTIQAEVPIQIVVCIECFHAYERCIIFSPANHNGLSSWLFSQKGVGYDATWEDLEIAYSEILLLTDRVEILQGGQTFVVTASYGTAASNPNALENRGPLDCNLTIEFHVEKFKQRAKNKPSLLNYKSGKMTQMWENGGD